MPERPRQERYVTTIKREDTDGKVKRFVVNPMRKFYYAATDQEDPKKRRMQA